MASIEILSIASDVPQQKVASEDILNKTGGHLSAPTLDMLHAMDIENRYSVIENYPEYLVGEKKRKLIGGVNELGVNSIRKCMEQTSAKTEIGLLIAVTNTAERPLPCMAYDLISLLNDDLIPHNINIINMQNQGCSALIKAFELASYYLQAYPQKQVLVCVAEAHTAMFPPTLASNDVLSFGEIKEIKDSEEQKKAMINLHNTINSYLFGDGAVSILLGHNANAESFKSHHLTNIESGDNEILYMNEGGSKIPCYTSFPKYTLGKLVPQRGAVYSKLLLEQIIQSGDIRMHIDNFNYYLIHTGSKKIINAVQKNLMLDEHPEKIAVSYQVLKNYANLSSCSIGFMLDKLINEQKKKGHILLVSFGVGFSGSVATLKI